jgi:hypothetical protein
MKSGKIILKAGYVILACFLAVALSSCGGKNMTRKPPITGLARVAILPMDRASTKPAGERPSCNISDSYAGVYTIPIDAATKGTRLLLQNFGSIPGFFEITEAKCLGFLNSALASDINRSQLKMIRMYGKELKADAVLYGKIHRYRDRVGNDYSVDTPASVAFTISLVRVMDGATLWRYSFDQTQQALTENLFNFKLYRSEGMKWLTASELMQYGIKQAAADLRARFDASGK